MRDSLWRVQFGSEDNQQFGLPRMNVYNKNESTNFSLHSFYTVIQVMVFKYLDINFMTVPDMPT